MFIAFFSSNLLLFIALLPFFGSVLIAFIPAQNIKIIRYISAFITFLVFFFHYSFIILR